MGGKSWKMADLFLLLAEREKRLERYNKKEHLMGELISGTHFLLRFRASPGGL
jgi:hypothetical protein